MSYTATLERMVKQRIINDLANHRITLKHSDGMYRHWRCQQPGTWNLGFDIITWPGSLCYTGDMGDYLFQRTHDMVEFMRQASMSYSYAAEKCVAHDGRLKEFRHELFEELLQNYVADRGLEGAEESELASVRRKIDDLREAAKGDYDTPQEVMQAIYESGLWDGCDMPSCEAWTFHFLWGLHAIKWFCDSLAAGVNQSAA